MLPALGSLAKQQANPTQNTQKVGPSTSQLRRHTSRRHHHIVFRGFYESHEPHPSGDARGIVPPHRDGHQNGKQSGYMFHYCCVDCRPGGRRGNTERVVAR